MESPHKQYANGLRELASWYEEHEEISLPSTDVDCFSLDTKEEAAKVAKAFGKCRKDYNEYHLVLSSYFGPIRLRFVFGREKVCTRRVVAVETIPAEFVEAHVKPARTKEIVEWDCLPILAPSENHVA